MKDICTRITIYQTAYELAGVSLKEISPFRITEQEMDELQKACGGDEKWKESKNIIRFYGAIRLELCTLIELSPMLEEQKRIWKEKTYLQLAKKATEDLYNFLEKC